MRYRPSTLHVRQAQVQHADQGQDREEHRGLPDRRYEEVDAVVDKWLIPQRNEKDRRVHILSAMPALERHRK